MPSSVMLRTGSSNADNATVYECLANAERFNTWYLGSVGGAMDVLVSGDGTNFLTANIALVDLASTTPATAVIETAPNGNYRFSGRWKAVRVMQKGATAVTSAYIVAEEGH